MASTNVELPRYVSERWTDHNPTIRYRRVVPADIQAQIGRKVWTRTWKPGTSHERIRSEAATLTHDYDRIVKEARGEVVTPAVVKNAEALYAQLADPKLRFEFMALLHREGRGEDLQRQAIKMMPDRREEIMKWPADDGLGIAEQALVNIVEHGGTYQAETVVVKLSEAMDLDQKNNADLRSSKPVIDAVRSFTKFAGDVDLATITHGQVTDWKVDCLTTQKPGSVSRRMATLAAMTKRTYKYHAIKRDNPFSDHKFPKTDKRAGRMPLNKTHLELLDNHLATSNSIDRQTLNMLMIARNTLTGAKEIAGLMISDLRLDDPIPHAIFRLNDLRDVKNAYRERETPLVGVALEAARDALEAAQARGDATGPDATPVFLGYSSKRGADTLSIRMTRVLRTAGIPNTPRLTAYSLRHSMKQALRKSRCPDYIEHDLMGHSSRGVADDYGAESELEAKRDALIAALPHMGAVDDKHYKEEELV